jgi:hypothetical protein
VAFLPKPFAVPDLARLLANVRRWLDADKTLARR